jgi:hypothetical protein
MYSSVSKTKKSLMERGLGKGCGAFVHTYLNIVAIGVQHFFLAVHVSVWS